MITMSNQGRKSGSDKYYLPEVTELLHWLRQVGGYEKYQVKRAQRLEKRETVMPTFSCRFCDDGLLIRVRRKKLMQIVVVFASKENSQMIYHCLQKEDFRSSY